MQYAYTYSDPKTGAQYTMYATNKADADKDLTKLLGEGNTAIFVGRDHT